MATYNKRNMGITKPPRPTKTNIDNKFSNKVYVKGIIERILLWGLVITMLVWLITI